MTAKSALDARAVLARLPHRYPMVLIDRVERVETGRRLVAIKCVSANEPCFPGHFPQNPVFPGVLLVEAMAQAGGLLAALSDPGGAAERGLFLLGIDSARFRRPVVPGDRLQIEVIFRQRRGDVWKLDTSATVDGQKAAEAIILLGLAKR